MLCSGLQLSEWGLLFGWGLLWDGLLLSEWGLLWDGLLLPALMEIG
jgi:hypothetical protein